MLRVVLTLAILLTISAATQITTNLRFFCNSQSNWRFAIMFYEHDTSSPWDRLLYTETQIIEGQPSKDLNSIFDVYDGDGPLDFHYEIYMRVTHSCARFGNAVNSHIFLGSVSIFDRFASFQGNVILDA
ncbi:unnamed protein product [Caenorhabditis angaria]|uniref:Uncharacterized protein n=1 Tax=Caenorhabditis angaria TaxID=860376 RepID=A0A9P1I8T2_9PELO|nr:unnamed protein product [Caenorhabditis angaria]